MNKIIYSSLTLLLLAACSSEQTQEKKENTVLDQKIDVIKEAKSVVDTINEKTEEIMEETVVANEEAVAEEEAVVKEAASGSSIYQSSCASCHGANGEKPALNASAIISTWSSKKIQDALLGYKNGTYGGKMKAVMQGQSKPLSDKDIKLLSDYISNL